MVGQVDQGSAQSRPGYDGESAASANSEPSAALGPWFAQPSSADFWFVTEGLGEYTPAVASTWGANHEAKAHMLAAAPEVTKALSDLLTFFSPPGEDSMERFERIAAEFHRETGMLAPGKSEPMEMGYQGRDEERRERYDRWVADRVAAGRAAIAKALGASPASPAEPVALPGDAR